MIEHLNALGITNAMFTSAVITVTLSIIAVFSGRNLRRVPSGLQNFLEWLIGGMYGFFEEIMGKRLCRRYFPLIGTLFLYILISNYSGLLPGSGHVPGLAAPTSSINAPMAMAVVVFAATQYVGIREHGGLGYYKHFLKPFVFMLPLLIIEEVVRPVSLTLRLYGNILGEETVAAFFFHLVPLGVPVTIHALSMLMGLVQALVFALLTSIYLKEAGDTEEESLDTIDH